jgi:FkbM family methyltransferase
MLNTFFYTYKYTLNQSNWKTSVKIFNKAISDKKGKASFVRLCGNIAGSHLSGDKPNPYGKIETFEVDIEPIVSHLEWADFAKIDVEGHEKVILLATEKQHWEKLDAIIEIGNPENGRAIFEHMSSLGVSMYPQKINWEKAKTLKDLPDNYKEGNVFLSSRGPMLW